jgi:hypothetical protein
MTYVFAVAFRQLTDGTVLEDEYFSSVPFGFKSLLLYAIIPDQAAIVDGVGREHVLLGVLMLLFILLGSLTVMNMLVGVLVEVVSVVSAVEKEGMKLNFIKSQLFMMIRRIGLEPAEDMMLTRQDFQYLLVKQGAAKVFKDIGVDPVAFIDIGNSIFDEAGPEGLTFKEFIEVVLQMRGTNMATVKDVVDLRRTLGKRLQDIGEALTALQKVAYNLPPDASVSMSAMRRNLRSLSNLSTVSGPSIERPSMLSTGPFPPQIPEDDEVSFQYLSEVDGALTCAVR